MLVSPAKMGHRTILPEGTSPVLTGWSNGAGSTNADRRSRPSRRGVDTVQSVVAVCLDASQKCHPDVIPLSFADSISLLNEIGMSIRKAAAIREGNDALRRYRSDADHGWTGSMAHRLSGRTGCGKAGRARFFCFYTPRVCHRGHFAARHAYPSQGSRTQCQPSSSTSFPSSS